ncbi:MAG: threonine synthase [Coriobacteriales bacterium]|jgi:threonine synthase|nr:threonine synthase [Coriobacteriales bacterium]
MYDSIEYLDTRGYTETPLPFSTVIIKGLAAGGGLFVPEKLPQLDLTEIVKLASLPYAQQAALVFDRFGIDFSANVIDRLMQQAYGENFDTPVIAPVVEVAPRSYLLELFHGPTAAFKDMALQCLPWFFSLALEKPRDAAGTPMFHLILVATSGDTGSAALAGFRDREHTGVIVFYPRDGVSDIQSRQMTAAEGANVGVVAVQGNFDDCQNAVKTVFNDAAFTDVLAGQGVKLASANSINWGRLLPQVVYYASAYSQLVASGSLELGEQLDVCVPTGNFGNILAAWYARAIGVPIGRLYCASNDNNVLTDFINSGTYDISQRSFKLTPSPSMDILVSSNLERQLFELNGHDAGLIRKWMRELSEQRRFQVDEATFAALRESFSADWVSSEESLETIREVFQQFGYLLEPHTAVAWKVAERLRMTPDSPVLIVATSHWAKFASDVYRALHHMAPGEALPDEVAGLSGPQLVARIAEQHTAGSIPQHLAELDSKPIRFDETCANTAEAVSESIVDWLEQRRLID